MGSAADLVRPVELDLYADYQETGRLIVMDAEGLFAIIQSRRSIRRYVDRPVPADVLRRVLEAGRWAPSAHNRQPWRFAVITDPARRVASGAGDGRAFSRRPGGGRFADSRRSSGR